MLDGTIRFDRKRGTDALSDVCPERVRTLDAALTKTTMMIAFIYRLGQARKSAVPPWLTQKCSETMLPHLVQDLRNIRPWKNLQSLFLISQSYLELTSREFKKKFTSPSFLSQARETYDDDAIAFELLWKHRLVA